VYLEIRVKDLGLTVAIDFYGGNLYAQVQHEARKKMERLFEELSGPDAKSKLPKLDNPNTNVVLPTKLSARAAQNASTFTVAESLPLRFPPAGFATIFKKQIGSRKSSSAVESHRSGVTASFCRAAE